MIAVDTNILVYAHRKESQKHALAFEALRNFAEGSERWAIPLFCIGEFMRILTHPKIFNPPHSYLEAINIVQVLLDSPSLSILYPGENYLKNLTEIVAKCRISGNLIFDAQIAAVCRENAVSAILTEDNDFDRFDFLNVRHLA